MQVHATPFPPGLHGSQPAQRPVVAEAAPVATALSPPAAEQAPDVRGVGGSGASAETGEEQREGYSAGNQQASEAEQSEIAEQVRALAARDREVRAHESAHMAAAGGLARGGISLETERGPDGRQYAVGGEVRIDTSAVAGDPQATIAKARQIRRAALAPAEPSSADRSVASQAAAMEAAATAELAARGDEVDSTGAPTDGSADNEGASAVAGEGARSASGAEPCPMCGGGDHGRGEHVAGNERRLAAGLGAVPSSDAGPGLNLLA